MSKANKPQLFRLQKARHVFYLNFKSGYYHIELEKEEEKFKCLPRTSQSGQVWVEDRDDSDVCIKRVKRKLNKQEMVTLSPERSRRWLP